MDTTKFRMTFEFDTEEQLKDYLLLTHGIAIRPKVIGALKLHLPMMTLEQYDCKKVLSKIEEEDTELQREDIMLDIEKSSE